MRARSSSLYHAPISDDDESDIRCMLSRRSWSSCWPVVCPRRPGTHRRSLPGRWPRSGWTRRMPTPSRRAPSSCRHSRAAAHGCQQRRAAAGRRCGSRCAASARACAACRASEKLGPLDDRRVPTLERRDAREQTDVPRPDAAAMLGAGPPARGWLGRWAEAPLVVELQASLCSASDAAEPQHASGCETLMLALVRASAPSVGQSERASVERAPSWALRRAGRNRVARGARNHTDSLYFSRRFTMRYVYSRGAPLRPAGASPARCKE